MTSTITPAKAGDSYSLSTKISEDEVLSLAKEIVVRRFDRGQALNSPSRVREYLGIYHSQLEREEFSVLFLDSQNHVLAFSTLSTGTIDGASVYPREVVKQALKENAAATILVHNHPSGEPEPSDADRRITKQIKKALDTVEIRLLDHIVVGGMKSVSMAERDLL